MGVIFPEALATPQGMECHDAYGCFPCGGAVLPRETPEGRKYLARGDLFVYASQAARNNGAQVIKIESIQVDDVDPEAAVYSLLYARVKSLYSCYDSVTAAAAPEAVTPAEEDPRLKK
jgi:hypothetical protein